MNWLASLSQSDKDEMFQDACQAFQGDVIAESEYIMTLVKLGYNATEIADLVKEFRPPAPEEQGD
jgi:Holliday junction resolvasome RuvABC DNA-binding subunit